MIEIVINCEKKRYFEGINVKLLSKTLKKYITNRLNCKHDYEQIFLNYNLVSRKNQIKINEEYLDHNYNTDIITFDLSSTNEIINGDIYISYKQVIKNTQKYGTEFYEEINRVFIHGCLHLFGYGDKSVDEIRVMRREENKFIKYYSKNVPRGTN